MLIGGDHLNPGVRSWVRVSWASPIRRARRPAGATRRAGYGEGGFEALYCSQGYYVGGWVGVVFGAAGEYIDVRQCKGSGDFAEEGCFLLVGLDQGQVDLGSPDFYGQAGEAGA